MAELNFGLLNPPGSQSIGNAFVTGMDQAAAARAQENQNALSQYTLSKARREDQIQNAINSAYQGAIGPDGTIDYGRVNAALAAGGAGAKIPESEAARRKAELDRVDLDIKRETLLGQPGIRKKIDAETSKLKGEARFKAIGEVASFPNADAAHAAIDARFASGVIDQATADEMRSGLTPDNFDKWQIVTLRRLLNPADQLKQSALTHTDTDRGGYIGRQYFDAQGQPSGTELRLEKTITPSTAATLKQAQDHYNSLSEFQRQTLAQQGWTFDSDRGLAVNAKLGISRPISTLMSPVGGGVPAAPSGVAAPAVPGVAGGGVPGQRQAPAGQPAAVAGVLGPKPEKATWNSEAGGFIYSPSPENPTGKFVAIQGMEGKSLNETQAKGALYGSAMQQANTVITELAKSGTLKPAVVPGLLEGIVKLAPLGIGDAAANAIESTFRTDPTGLVGPDANQQKLAQAQLGFAIALLRFTSGAAFGAQEVANTIKEYFPLQGEGKEVIQQKAASRDRAIQGMKLSAGRSGSDFINRYSTTIPDNQSTPPLGAVRPRRN